ncbi:hypothetical protein GCM10011354_17060 [Egicoccus halophilus]|uniref:Peptidase S8/S53 domain-containing protein n=1 Tax=Egicoccus halophilus TaxID=1670830 RepID=A0A8J3AA38_9ACTN|nr:hypothetical protein GCM10011354_17060 [Egicoccus halophilus]
MVALLLVASVVAANVGPPNEERGVLGAGPIVTLDGVPLEQVGSAAVVRVDPVDGPGDDPATTADALAAHPGVGEVRRLFGDWYALDGVDGATAATFDGVLAAQDDAHAQLAATARPEQWHLHNRGQRVAGQPGAEPGADIDWERTQQPSLAATGADVVVAVVDNGVDVTHPALAGRIWQDQDDETCVELDTCYGWDFVADAPLALDRPAQGAAHGTLIAGAIAAAPVVGGTSRPGGVAVDARIMPLTITYGDDGFLVSRAAAAIRYAVDHGADVVNASWGTLPGQARPDDVPVLEDAIRYARDAGVVVVAAAGNQQSDLDVAPVYPASFPQDNLLTVAATTPSDTIATYSNVGRATVDVAAPGSSIVGPSVGGGYATLSGTSMAAAVTSGVVAQTLSARQDLGSDAAGAAARQAVVAGATRLFGLRDHVRSSGRVSAAGALGLPPRLDGGLVVTGEGFEAIDPDREFVARLNVLAPRTSELAFTLGVWHDGAVHAVVGRDVEVTATGHIASVGGPSSGAGRLGLPRLPDTSDLETTGRDFTVGSLLPTGRYVLLVEETAPTRRAGYLAFHVGEPPLEHDPDTSGGPLDPLDPTRPDDGSHAGDPACDVSAADCDLDAAPDCDTEPRPAACDTEGLPLDPAPGDGDPGDGDPADGAPVGDGCPTNATLDGNGVCVPSLQNCADGRAPTDGTCAPQLAACPTGTTPQGGTCVPVGAPATGTPTADAPASGTPSPTEKEFVPVFPPEGPMSGRTVDVKGDWNAPEWAGARVFFNEREAVVLAPLRTVAAVRAPAYPRPGSVHVSVRAPGGRLLEAYEHAFTYVDGSSTTGPSAPGSGSGGTGTGSGGNGSEGGGSDATDGNDGGSSGGGGSDGGGGGDSAPAPAPAPGTGPAPTDEAGWTSGQPTTLPNGLTVDRFTDDHPLSRLTASAWGDDQRCTTSPCRGTWIDTRKGRF